MTELVIALLMIIDGEVKEHRIQIDPRTGKPSMAMCLKGKRHAQRTESRVTYNTSVSSRWLRQS